MVPFINDQKVRITEENHKTEGYGAWRERAGLTTHFQDLGGHSWSKRERHWSLESQGSGQAPGTGRDSHKHCPLHHHTKSGCAPPSPTLHPSLPPLWAPPTPPGLTERLRERWSGHGGSHGLGLGVGAGVQGLGAPGLMPWLA